MPCSAQIAGISSIYVFMFILFGVFLLQSDAGEFVIDLARSVAGRIIGGPGLVAVMASGLMGTISGSAVTNTASTGLVILRFSFLLYSVFMLLPPRLKVIWRPS
ncbi:MAG: TRAP transporter large permease subunit [Desulfuromusa sp.]|nr:TRAP transporter large permease subunit [Desulfuromusa sp.]